MVKKKTRRKIIKPPQPKLDTVFNCLVCGHKKSVVVKFNRKEKTGPLLFKQRARSFSILLIRLSRRSWRSRKRLRDRNPFP